MLKEYVPSLASHIVLNPLPDPFHNLSIPPSACGARSNIVLVDLCRQHCSPPSPDGVWRMVSPPPDIDTQSMLEELIRLLPLVALELPYLARSEDSHHPRPILRLELFRCIHDDEADGARGIDGG